MPTDRVQRASGRVSSAKRWGNPDLAEAQAELLEAQVEAVILKALPDLSPEACQRLAKTLIDGSLL